MKFSNNTKNQHYVSQVEQRLNSSAPNAAKKAQKIYSFKIIDREACVLKMEGRNPKSIERNLSMLDLFTFDLETKVFRDNFESLFSRYESEIEHNTLSILQKLNSKNNEITSELINIFTLKLLNTFRNPHCVIKTLNTIGDVVKYQPADKGLSDTFQKFERGNRPHEKYICNKIGITSKEYADWLKALFMMLFSPTAHNSNMLEDVVKSLFECDSHIINVFVFYYEDDARTGGIALSDRGFTIPMEKKGLFAYSFNLSSKAFITYVFTDINETKNIHATQEVIDSYKKSNNKINFRFIKNSLDALKLYNQTTVYQAFETVYCSKGVVYGLE